MESVPYHPLIVVTPEQMKQVREEQGMGDSKRINESLDAVEEWCRKQEHLAKAMKYLSRNHLEKILILAKGSVEGTKIKVDKLLTTRGMMPDICLNKSVEEFEKLWSCISYVPLPKLNPSDNTRVMVTQAVNENLANLSILSYIRNCFLIGEYRYQFDYTVSERYIVDLENVGAGILTKLNPVVLKKGEILCTEGYGTKIKGIHLLNAPSFVDKIVYILKQGLKEKVASRLYVHSSYEELHQHIAKEILPKDYGGDGPSIAKLAEQWKDTLKTAEARKLIEDAEYLVSDESKRSSLKFNEEYLGMPGSFRKLNVD